MRSCFRAALLLSLLAGCHPFRAEVPEVRDGIRAFEQSKYPDAQKRFDAAIERRPSPEAHFDDGAALARQHQLKAAEEQFGIALDSHDDRLKARSYLDLGNAHGDAGELDPAIEAYRRALELDPSDADARYNLEWALRKKDAQNKKKNGDGKPQANNDKNQDKGQKKDDKDQQAKNDASKPGDKQGDQKSDPQKQDGQAKNGQGDPQQEQQPGQPPKPDQKDAQAQNDADAQKKQDGQQQPPPPQPGQQQNQNQQQNQPQAMAGQNGPQGEEHGQTQLQPAKPMSQQDSKQVLDALQASEKNLQMWRFQVERHHPRSGDEKDW